MNIEEELSEYDENRRRFLVKTLSSGILLASTPSIANAFTWGNPPAKLTKGQSIYSLEGHVTVDGKVATKNTIITPSSKIITAKKSQIVFAVGTDSMILRSNTKMQLEGSSSLISTMRLITGKLLSVFGHRSDSNRLKLKSPIATIGIRGTGVYMEASEDETYLCTCYGQTEISSNLDKNDSQIITSLHHDQPKYITKKPHNGSRIRKAPFLNHTDQELKIIEALVGREVPFGAKNNLYSRERRDY